MMFRRLSVLAACAALAACSTPPEIPAGIQLVHTKHLSRLIAPSAPELAANPTGTLRTWVSVKNLSQRRVLIEGRAVFTGAQGQPVESPSGWMQIFLEPETTGRLQFNSVSTAAKQVTIELREGNR